LPHQLDAELFDEFELCAQFIDTEKLIDEEETTATRKKPGGRKPLPKNLPREVIEHDLSDEEKICACGNDMEYIGANVSEELNYVPAKLTVIEHRCKKYGCAICNERSKKEANAKAQLKTAKKPLQLIPKSIASNALLAQIAIQKFLDYLPLYRQEQIFKRHDIALSRQTMSEWMLKVGVAIIPLINLLQDKILEYDISFADETTLQVLNEPGRRAKTKSYMWCFIGGPLEQQIIIYQYHTSRGGDIAEQFFAGYQGALHCDGYQGYNALLSSDNIVGINCMAHVRRKFVEALPNGKLKGVSGQVVRVLQELYQIEAKMKETKLDVDAVKQVRQEKSKPLLEKLKTYLDDKVNKVPPKSKVGEAIKYTLKRWHYLITYLQDGRYEIDNNRCERAIKPFVLGRKAWLFANSTGGAHTSARLYSLIETAKANELNPLKYLKYIFTKLPYCQHVDDYEALLPWNVKSALENFK
jgi:transposase